MSAAILRINRSLEVATVLEEVEASARSLTGARLGVMTTVDEQGTVQDLVTGGFSAKRRRQMLDWPDGPQFFDHLRHLSAPLRIADVPEYLRSLGLSAIPGGSTTLQGTPMLYQGEYLGIFFLGDKRDGREFTSDDEEILVLFASQAATAIANARTHTAVERARADLEALERQRAEFLEMVSHELRAPLTSIKGSASTALGATPAPPQAELLQFFRIIDGQADHMRSLITNLLDAGSIDAGTLTVAPQPSSVVELVDAARNNFLSGGGSNPVIIDLPPTLPPALADPERITQVLNNLLSNSARHSSASSPIGIEAVHENGFIAISVSDKGEGIAPERLSHLFERRSRLAEGTGLGLAICKGLVEAHGGRIEARSDGPGHGARFTFTIPAVSSESVAATAEPRTTEPPEAEASILIIDDDPHALYMMRDALSAVGYAPLTAGDSHKLAQLVRAEKPDLVLLDLMLPDADGIELMNDTPELADIPIIFVSGYGRDETIARALHNGAADYIVKPFSAIELVARVQAALRGRTQPQTYRRGDLSVDFARRQVSLAGQAITLTATEFDVLRVLAANAGGVVTTEVLLEKVWGHSDSRHSDRIRAAVRKLRAKLGDNAARPAYVFTEHGIGYRLAAPSDT
ncbi:ATP-binding protein [Candidatus Poriferisodalis sp.]|uniref:ATP-binding protein n=1 Tax=Candidatus Poriferisodalis sp. TaxID=3101277 RepID=UPI003B5C1E09